MLRRVLLRDFVGLRIILSAHFILFGMLLLCPVEPFQVSHAYDWFAAHGSEVMWGWLYMIAGVATLAWGLPLRPPFRAHVSFLMFTLNAATSLGFLAGSWLSSAWISYLTLAAIAYLIFIFDLFPDRH